MKQKYLNKIQGLTIPSIVSQITHHNTSKIMLDVKRDILYYTNFLIHNENWAVKINCYLNSIQEYNRCESNNIILFGQKLCKVSGCKCKWESYKNSNKNLKIEDQSLETTLQHARTKKMLNNIKEIYTKKETADLLLKKSYYKKLFGKAKNRTLIKNNPKLYKSIMKYTECLKIAFAKQGNTPFAFNFSHRILFIVEKKYNIHTLKCECGQKYSWTGYCNKCPNPKKTMLGKKMSKESKLKCRLAAIKRITTSKGRCCPNYNRNSISIIDEYGKQHGYEFLHAENGGEFYIKELGYWLDAYDEERNVVLEIDERRHFDIYGNLKEKDIIRQKEIENILKCKFLRIRYEEK